MAHAPTDDQQLELDSGRTIGYATWGDPEGTPVFFAHGMPGSRRTRCPSLDDPEWLAQRRLRFIGVDRPGYGYSDPWPAARLLDCAEDFVRVADHLSLESFSAMGFSGGGPYAIALRALAPERAGGGVAVVSGLGPLDRPDAFEGMDEASAAGFEMAPGNHRKIWPSSSTKKPHGWYARAPGEVSQRFWRSFPKSIGRSSSGRTPRHSSSDLPRKPCGRVPGVGSTTSCAWCDLGLSGSVRSAGSACASITERPMSWCLHTTRSIWPRVYREATCDCMRARDTSPSTDTSRRSRKISSVPSPPNAATIREAALSRLSFTALGCVCEV